MCSSNLYSCHNHLLPKEFRQELNLLSIALKIYSDKRKAEKYWTTEKVLCIAIVD